MKIQGSPNVFRDLGFADAEAENLRLRSQLMILLREHIREQSLTNGEAARVMRVDQSCISNLLRGEVDLFSIDTLVNMLATAGLQVDVQVKRVA